MSSSYINPVVGFCSEKGQKEGHRELMDRLRIRYLATYFIIYRDMVANESHCDAAAANETRDTVHLYVTFVLQCPIV